MSLAAPEGDPSIRYGFYLRPSAAMSRAQAEVHDLLARQFGIVVGGKFMPHATIMGFHRSDAKVEAMRSIWAEVARGQAPFAVHNAGPIPFGRSSFVLNVHQLADGSANPALVALHRAAYGGIEPRLHPDCEFSRGDWAGDRFHAHLTLAMADVPAFAFDEVHGFMTDLGPIGPSDFRAEYVAWYAFQSDDWGGAWWESMRWRLLDSWRLSG